MSIFDLLEAGGYNPDELSDVPKEFWKAILNPTGMAKGIPSLAGIGVQTFNEDKKKVTTNGKPIGKKSQVYKAPPRF